MQCNFSCLDVEIFKMAKKYYEGPQVQDALKKASIGDLLPRKTVVVIDDDKTINNGLVNLYRPLLVYLTKEYSVLWTSLIIYDPLISDYKFRTIKIGKDLSLRFDEVHKFADTDYYKKQMLSLTKITFVDHDVQKTTILSKGRINNLGDDFLSIDVSSVTELIGEQLNGEYDEGFNVQNEIERVATILRDSVDILSFPEELAIKSKDDRLKFFKYLIWLQMLDQHWNFYYYIPATTFLPKETSGQAIATREEIGERDIWKTVVINGIIQEPIARSLQEKMNYRNLREGQFEIFEYPHAVGSYVVSSIREALAEGNEYIHIISGCLNYLMYKNMYLQLLGAPSEEEKPRKEKRKLMRIISSFVSSYIFASLMTHNIREGAEKWEAMFSNDSIIWTEEAKSLKLKDMYPGIIENILEHMVCNSIVHGHASKFTIEIATIEKNRFKMTCYDNGVGFGEDIINNLKRWDRLGPGESEGKTGFGFRSIYKATVELGNGEKYRECTPINCSEKYRVKEIFIFHRG